jgi:hypothetical protein
VTLPDREIVFLLAVTIAIIVASILLNSCTRVEMPAAPLA